MSKHEVMIVSAFGRGHSLAVQLARQGLKVCLLDLTESLGIWIPENADGPFGIFQSEKFKEYQWERILEDDPPLMCAQGFTLWLKDGPLELKSNLTKHRLEKLGVDEIQQDFILSQAHNWQSDDKKLEKLKKQTFQNSWLARLSLLLATNVHQPSAGTIKTKQAVPLFSNYFIRFASRQGHKRSLDWCSRNNVEVLPRIQVLDFALQDRSSLKTIQFRSLDSEKSEQLEAEQFVWCLTSEETSMQGIRLQEKLYPSGYLRPEWIWIRYRLKIETCHEREQLPLQFLLIPELYSHWMHENFLLCQRTASAELFDAWIQIPDLQRFNRDYLQMRGERIVQFLQSKMTQAKIEIYNMPLELESTYKEIGPSRTPIFDYESKQKLKKKNFKNISYHSFEETDLLSWEAQLGLDLINEEKIMSWWNKKQELLRKQEAKLADKRMEM